jgi:DMSO/TMAO reductase YedYZ molybdopterin-dependent catalytic subunit
MSRRRKVLVATGAILTGTSGVILSTQEADAVSVSMGEMNVPDTTTTGEPGSVDIAVETNLEWDSPQSPTGIQVILQAGDTDSDLYEITSKQVSVDTNTGTKTTTITGDVTKSMALSLSDFEIITGQTARHVDVEVGLNVTLYNTDRDLATASVSDTATITVNEDTGSVSIAAEGSWEIQ